MSFAIHPRLRSDTHLLGRLEVSWLLLHRTAAVPWFLLVPETDRRELHELDPATRAGLQREADQLAVLLHSELSAEKINVAAIGNIVPQLHVHVVGRRADDPAWPGVVWGRLDAEPKRDANDVLRIQRIVGRVWPELLP